MTTSLTFPRWSTLEETTRILSQPQDGDSMRQYHNRLICILSVAQHCGIDFLPVTWLPGQDKAGIGGQSQIYQYAVSDGVGLVFKALSIFMHTWPDEDGESRVAMAVASIIKEMSILSQPLVRETRFVLKLEGVSWNAQKDYAWPVLVYRRGMPLRDWLVGRPNLSLEQKLYVCTAICQGLAALHRSGVVHADIKPSNIIISRWKWPEDSGDDDAAIPRISDLGASLIGSDEDLFQLSRSRGWTAPEWHERFFQLQNARRMDVFSFGLVVYWILAWDIKFSHLSVDDEVTEMIRLTDPKPDGCSLPLRESMKLLESLSLEHELRETITTFFRKSLALNPQDRATGAEHLLSFLDKDARLPPTPTALPSPIKADRHSLCRFRLVDWIEQLSLADFRVREQVFSELKSAMLSRCSACRQNCSLQAAVCCELAFGCEMSIEERDQYLTAGNWTDADYKSELSQFVSPKSRSLPPGLQYFFQNDLVHEYQRRDDVSLACEHLKREAFTRSEKLGNIHILTTPLKAMLASVLDAAGQYDAALSVQIDLYATLNTQFGETDAVTIAAKSQLALLYHNGGHSSRALVTGREAYALCQDYLERDDRTRMNTMANLAIILYTCGLLKEAGEIQKEVVKQHEEVLGMQHPDTVKCYMNQAVFLRRQAVGVADVSYLLMSIVRRFQLTSGIIHRDSLWAQSNLIDCLSYDYLIVDEEILELREMIFTHSKRFLGELNPETWIFASKLVSALTAMGRWDEARNLYATLKDKLEHLCGPTHDTTLDAIISFAKDHLNKMLYEESYSILNEALKKSATLSGIDSDTALTCLMEMGNLLEKQGKSDDAETVWRQLISITDSRCPNNVLGTRPSRRARSGLAMIYFESGKQEEGRELLRGLIEWTTEYLGRDDHETMDHECFLAASLVDAGRYKEGLEILLDLRGRMKVPENLTYDVHRGIVISLTRAYHRNGMADKAISVGEYFLPLFQTQLGESHEDTLTVQNNLSVYYSDTGEHEKAEKLLLRLHETYEQRGNEHMCLITLSNLADTYISCDRISDGISLHRKVMARQELQSGVQSTLYMEDAYYMAKILHEHTDCLEEAARWAEMSWEYFNSRLGYNSAETVKGAWRLGSILQKLGRHSESRTVIESQLKGARDMDSDDKDEWIKDGEKVLQALEMDGIESAMGRLVS